MVVETPLKVFFCPSNRSTGYINLDPLETSAFLTAVRTYATSMTLNPPFHPAATDYVFCKGSNACLASSKKQPLKSRGAFGVNSQVTLDDITDGTSNTIAIGEGAGGNPHFMLRAKYTDGTPATGSSGGPVPADQGWAVPAVLDVANTTGGGNTGGNSGAGTNQYYFGAVMGITAIRDGFNDAIGPQDEAMNGLTGLQNSQTQGAANPQPLILAAIDYDQPGGPLNPPGTPTQEGTNKSAQPFDTLPGFRSMHPGGCYFVFCDGHVQFVKETIAPATYRALSTIAGGEAVNDSDY
jgi:prepilin-type processing-associated H-X9-DG protein